MEEWEIYSKRLGYGILYVFILLFSFLIIILLGFPWGVYIVFLNSYALLLVYSLIVLLLGVYGINLIEDSIKK